MTNKKLQAIINYIFLASGLILLILDYSSNYALSSALFNADALYLPALIDDLFNQNGQISDWYLTPAPYLFPDFLIYSAVQLFRMDAANQIAAYAVLQVIGTTSLIYLIYRKFEKNNAGSAAVLAVIVFILLGLTIGSTGTLSKTGNAYVFIFTSAFHYGAFLAQLIFFTIAFLYVDRARSEKPFWLAALSLIAFLSALSDSIFVVQFSLPFAGALLVSRLISRSSAFYSLPLAIIPLLSSLLGMRSYDFIIKNQTKYPIEVDIAKLNQQVDFLQNFFSDLFFRQTLLGMFLTVFYGLAFASLFYWPKAMLNNYTSSRLRFVLAFSFLSAFITIVATSIVTNLSSGPRYLIPVFYWPPIITILMMAPAIRWKQLHLISLSMLLVLVFLVMKDKGESKNQAGAEISNVRCIIDAINASGLHRGIAAYWDAKPIQVFSRGGIKVAQYNGELREHRWITSSDFYQKTYDFAVISEDQIDGYKLSRDKIIEANGKPGKEVNCGNKTLLAYSPGQMLIEHNKFTKVGSFYKWKACELPTRIGKATSECEMKKEDVASSGHLTFGPYEQLPAGQYTFEIAYSSNADKADAVGNWDVVLALPNEAKVLKNGLIAGTDGAAKKITGEFALDSGQNMEKIEIRTLAQPNKDLKVIYIRIQRVQ